MPQYSFAIWVSADGDTPAEAFETAMEGLLENILHHGAGEVPTVLKRAKDVAFPAAALEHLAEGRDVGIEEEGEDHG